MSEGAETPTWTIEVNGVEHRLALPGETPLLFVLREDLGLRGTRIGCNEGFCGACTVLQDGHPVQSCTQPLWAASGHAFTTIEGLSRGDRLGVLQRAFLDEQAAQCGYCSNGIIVTLTGLIARQPPASRDEIVRTLDERHLCRCGAQPRILRVVDRLLTTGDEAP